MRIFFLLIFFYLSFISIKADGNKTLMRQYNYALKSKNYLEGFSKNIGGNEFNYHSLRMDITEGMLTRCKNGDMEIEWLSQKVPSSNNENGFWFTWLAAVQMTNEHHKFTVFVNDLPRFEFISGNEENRKFSNADGGILEFTTIDLDQHNDAHGYMSLYAPSSWTTPGEPLKIKIIGETAGSNTWIIVYKTIDAVSYLQNLVKYETWLDVDIKYDGKDSYLDFISPIINNGKALKSQIGADEFTVKLNSNGENAVGKLKISHKDIRDESFSVRDENSELINLASLSKEIKQQQLQQKSLLINELKNEDDETIVFSKRIYKPQTVDNLLKLAKSNISKGNLYLMNSSHQDIAWMDSPEKCVIERDTMLLMPLYKKATKADPSYRFDVEDALVLKEFTTRHPDLKDGIKKLLQEGKISCGSSFIQPYEEMYSGEALVRQFYFGKKWLKKEFNYNARVYWNVDVPGKLLQMPQILKKSGTDYMVISRFQKGIYNWYSPDGSYVTTYSPGHYSEAFTPLHKNVYDAASYLAESSLDYEKYYSNNTVNNVIPVLSDWDMSPAVDYSNVINNWESINQLELKDGNKISIELPKFKIRTAEEFLDKFMSSASNIPRIQGERPAVWLYIHGPSHYEALKASREADILLTQAEKFATIDAMTENNFDNYPISRLSDAWESKIYPDHGWGGKEGQITDDLFLSKFLFSKTEANQLVENALNSLSSKIETNDKKGIPIVVFNSLSWKRSDPVNFELKFEKGQTNAVSLVNAEGDNVEIQLSEVSKYDDGSIEAAVVNFIAEDVPSIGYKTFYALLKGKENKQNNLSPYESENYKLLLADGGIKSIFDKDLDKELLDISKFLGGEVFTLQSEGNGAGEFADIQQPTMEGFDKTSNYQSKWELLENGPVYSTFKFRQQIKNAVIEEKVILYKKLKRIDFEISLLNWEGVLYREYRVALPLNMRNGQVSYETAFGVVNVGKDEIDGPAGERYATNCKEIHPRGIENWIGANNGNFGITLSSCVAVADYVDPSNLKSDQTILQPILLASRKSCHELGNEYLQTGNHFYSFSLTSHLPDWKNGFSFGKQANEKMKVVVNPKQFKNAKLPEVESFFLVDKENVIISTIKKAEDDNSAVVRLYDLFGGDTKVVLTSFKKISEVFNTNLIEEGKELLKSVDNRIQIDLGHNSIETLKIYPKY